MMGSKRRPDVRPYTPLAAEIWQDGRMPPDAPVARSAALAFVATMVAPGLGHLYLGRTRLALAVLVALGVVLPLIITAMVALQVPPLWSLAVAVSAGWGFALAIAIDAWASARRGDHSVPPGDRRGVYVGFLALSLAVGVTGSGLRKEYVIDFYKHPSGSMMPTIGEGEHFVVTKLHERGVMPARGDLIVFRLPGNPSEVFVKRVLAIGGDTVVDAPGAIVVNGAAWPRRACESASGPGQCWLERAPDGREYTILETPGVPARRVTATVPAGQVWVRGDNRGNSHDSAAFGPVAVEDVLGRARAIFLPLARLGALE